MFLLRVKTHFDAAHYIRDYEGKCSRVHGHRWEVEVVLQGTMLDKRNMLVDFCDIKGALDVCLEGTMDHYLLNESLHEPNVTAEFLAKWMYDRLPKSVQPWLVSVEVWESPNCSVRYCSERRI